MNWKLTIVREPGSALPDQTIATAENRVRLADFDERFQALLGVGAIQDDEYCPKPRGRKNSPDERRFTIGNDRQPCPLADAVRRSEEHTSELQSLMRNSYAVLCLKK